MLPLSIWLRRANPDAPALILPDRCIHYGEVAACAPCPDLRVLEGDAGAVALGLLTAGLVGETAFLPPPALPDRATWMAQARAAAAPALALVMATSGTEGAPKGVRLSWRAVAAAARIAGHALDLRPGDLWLACLPFHHIGGVMIPYRCWRAGASVLVHEGFDVETLRRDLHERRVSHISLTPPMLARLIEAAIPPPPYLRCALIGGAALSPALAERARAAGWPLKLSYGMTETCATALLDGRPLPGVRVRIAPPGVLEIATPARMTGYLGSANPGAWFASQDLAEIDADGRVNILGRADDMLVSGGVNVHPLEIEARLAACPGVREAGVTGLFDPIWGDVIACVYAGESEEPGVERWCRAELLGARRPRRFMRIERLPRTASGKLDRRALSGLWS